MNSQPKNPSSWCKRYEGFFGKSQLVDTHISLYALSSQLLEKLSSEKELFRAMAFLWNRYPDQKETDRYVQFFRVYGAVKTLDKLLLDSSFMDAWNDPSPTSWYFLPKDSLVVDVTSTLSYPYKTGIQRVVQELSRNIQLIKKDVCFVTARSTTHVQLKHVTEKELDHFLEVSERNVQEATGLWWLRVVVVGLLHSLKAASWLSLKSFFINLYTELRGLLVKLSSKNTRCKRLLGWVDRNKLKLRSLKTKLNSTRKNCRQKNLYLFDSMIVLPEIIQEEKRVDFYRTLRKYSEVKLLMIVYDLGPFSFPEFSAVGREFTHYLSLLRVCDYVSCISKSVAEDVKAYMKLIFREVLEKISISADLLAADFSKINSFIDPPPPRVASLSDTKFVLVVGTFEPRKNHLNILRAYQAFLLKRPDSNLKIVFSGNPGWRNEVFLQELELAQKNDRRIIQLVSVTDIEMAWLYQNCNFSVFCSHLEGFGLPILESLRWNKPVITSSRGSMAEIAAQFGGCITVSPNDTLDISRAIERFAIDDDELSSCKDSINFPFGYSWNEYAKNILSYFRNASPEMTFQKNEFSEEQSQNLFP